MKKALVFTLLFLFTLTAYSQIEYPRYDKDVNGQAIVMLTIEQAQALDNSTDLLLLFEKLNSQVSSYDSVCLKVVDQKNAVIAEQTIQINKLKESLQNKDDQIANLQTTLQKKDDVILTYQAELDNKNKEIDLHKGEIKRVKRKFIFAGIGGGVAIVGLIFALLVAH
jgi:chromosome segregation ATPase